MEKRESLIWFCFSELLFSFSKKIRGFLHHVIVINTIHDLVKPWENLTCMHANNRYTDQTVHLRSLLCVFDIVKYSKTCLKRPLSKRPKVCFQDKLSLNAGQKYCRMLQGEHSAILPTFIKLPFIIQIFVLSILEWPLKTGFSVATLAAWTS